MARRFIGEAIITITYHDAGDYRGTVRVGTHVWSFRDLHAPPCGHGSGVAYDSSVAYDKMAASAVAFGSYYTSGNRGAEDDLEAYPTAEVADAISSATWTDDRGRYEVRRSPNGPTRVVS